MLKSIGFGKTSPKETSWDEQFEKLIVYKSIHGNCAVPTVFKEDLKLGHWVSYN